MLLDTHALLWYMLGDRERISRSLQKRIESGPSIASVASLWEIAIKSALGKLEAPDDLPALVESRGFEMLGVTSEHAWAVRELPHHHRDPFDRLLIAQARVERLPILTADPAFSRYDVEVTWEG
jgi:PIN domain nuclease of toxin-antitoxin system